jgi:hypothetical protein
MDSPKHKPSWRYVEQVRASQGLWDSLAEQLAALKTIDIQTLAEALDERLVKKTGFTWS